MLFYGKCTVFTVCFICSGISLNMCMYQAKKRFVTLPSVNCRPFNIAQNATSEAEGRQLTVSKVTQRLCSIDPHVHM